MNWTYVWISKKFSQKTIRLKLITWDIRDILYTEFYVLDMFTNAFGKPLAEYAQSEHKSRVVRLQQR